MRKAREDKGQVRTKYKDTQQENVTRNSFFILTRKLI